MSSSMGSRLKVETLGAVEIRGRSSHIEIRNSVIGMDSASGDSRAVNQDVPITNRSTSMTT
jgi:hypothetical protein